MRAHHSKTKSSSSKVSGVCLHTTDLDKFMTCGDDGTIRIWSMSEKRCSRVIDLNIDENSMRLSNDPNTNEIREMSRLICLDIDHKSEFMAVGCLDGTVRVINMKNFD